MSVLLAVLEEALRREQLTTVLFATPESERNLPFPSHSRLAVVERPRETTRPASRLWWYEKGFGRAAKAAGANVTLSLSGAAIPGRAVPAVTFIQQSLPFSREALDCFGLAERARLRLHGEYMRRACARSAAVLVQTRTMVSTVTSAFMLPQGKFLAVLTMPPALTASGACEPTLQPMRAAPRGGRVLYVGNDSPYKNVPALQHALSFLSDLTPSPALFLTTPPAGNANPRIVELGALLPGALAEAYSLADVLVLPSYTETIGLPMIEAMRAGVPVCAADRPYAHEICGAAALYMDPNNPRSIASVVGRVLTDAGLRNQLIELGKKQAEYLSAPNGCATMLDLLLRTGMDSRYTSDSYAKPTCLKYCS